MLLAPVIARLKSQVSLLRHVGAAASLEQAVANVAAFPCAYLLAPREDAAPNEMINIVRHTVADRFSVLLAVKDVADATGESALAQIDAIRPTIIAALLNWSPDSTHDPIEFKAGQLLYAADGIAAWSDTFVTFHPLRSA